MGGQLLGDRPGSVLLFNATVPMGSPATPPHLVVGRTWLTLRCTLFWPHCGWSHGLWPFADHLVEGGSDGQLARVDRVVEAEAVHAVGVAHSRVGIGEPE